MQIKDKMKTSCADQQAGGSYVVRSFTYSWKGKENTHEINSS